MDGWEEYAIPIYHQPITPYYTCHPLAAVRPLCLGNPEARLVRKQPPASPIATINQVDFIARSCSSSFIPRRFTCVYSQNGSFSHRHRTSHSRRLDPTPTPRSPLPPILRISVPVTHQSKTPTRVFRSAPRSFRLVRTKQVARYSALVFGIIYGIVHQSTLQAKYDENKVSAVGGFYCWRCLRLGFGMSEAGRTRLWEKKGRGLVRL